MFLSWINELFSTSLKLDQNLPKSLLITFSNSPLNSSQEQPNDAMLPHSKGERSQLSTSDWHNKFHPMTYFSLAESSILPCHLRQIQESEKKVDD